MKQSLLIFSLMSVVLTGCETLPDRDPEFASVRPEVLHKPVRNTGSIYQSNFDLRLFEDQVARRVGDIVTIVFDEQMKAKKDADSKISKSSDISVTIPSIYGIDPAVALAALGKNGMSLDSEITAERDIQGKGNANQSNSLTGSISVTVVEVFSNGNLKVRGEKRVSLNQGSEYIRVSGIIRATDITATNTVNSSQLADATIMYTGDGAVADASRMGWASRLFMHWSFPF